MTPLPDLDQLISAVETESPGADPLARLASAARARDDLDTLTDALLDHFVEQARAAGCSWSQIGGVLGVSKQAAQQRHTAAESAARRFVARLPELFRSERPDRTALFSRFTADSRAVVVQAQVAAQRLQHHFIGTEHLLLGVLAGPDNVGARALAELGVTPEGAEAAVVDIIGRGSEPAAGHIPFTPRSKKILELALRHALKLGHKHIGPEHVLLALTAEGQGVAAQILARQGIDHRRTSQVILRLLEQ